MWNLMSLQCRRMPSFLAIADFLRPQSLELGSTFIYGVRISFESFSGVALRYEFHAVRRFGRKADVSVNIFDRQARLFHVRLTHLKHAFWLIVEIIHVQ